MRAVLLALVFGASSITAIARDEGGTLVTPDVLLTHIAKNAPETPVHPRLLWLDKGRRILFSVMAPQAQAGAGGGQFAEYVPFSYVQRTIDLQTGQTTDVGTGYDPAVSAQADVVAYFPEGSGEHRMVVTRVASGTSCTITDKALMPDATGIEVFALTGDGSQIAVAVGFGAPRFPVAKAVSMDGAAVKVFDGAMPEKWGHHVSVWVLDQHCRNPRRIADLPESRIGRLAWMDRDRKVIGVAATPIPGKSFPRSDLHIFDVTTRTARVLTPNIGGQGAAFLQPAPIGPYVAFTYDQEGFGYQLRKQLAIASIEDGRIRVVSTDPRERPRWLDARTLLADISGAHTLTRRSVALNLEGREEELAAIRANAIPSPDARRLAWLDIDLYGAAALSVADVRKDGGGWSARNERVIWRAESPLKSYTRAERRFVSCESKDGVRPQAILVLPIDHDKQRRYPLIVDLHGGPRGGLDGGSHGAYTPGTILSFTTLEHDMWAAKGYAVLVADYRASGLYGFNKVSRTGEAFAQDFDDIMCNVDAVIRDGVADPGRLAVIGHSYGGYEVNWIVTHSQRFKAAISKEGGFIDMMVAWGALGHTNQLNTKLYGSPLDNPETYRRMSPINFTRGVTTPTMFVTHRGGTMPGDLYGWMYAAWREQGVDAQYRVYDDPNHVLVGQADQRDQLYAAIAWIDRYLNNVPVSAPFEGVASRGPTF
jgi:dipeptidyl aminopeptidase/acylaminoacyl peptidase